MTNKLVKNNQKNTPSYFLSLSIKNIKCYGPIQKLDLSDGNGRTAQWTVILGDNGTGKTTLLQCLANSQPMELITEQPRRSNYHMPRLFVYDGPSKRFNTKHSSISANIAFGSKLQDKHEKIRAFNWYMESDEKSSLTPMLAPPEIQLRHMLPDDLICYSYGSSRKMGATSLAEKNFDTSESLFSDDAHLINAEEWLLQADYAASKKSSIQKQAIARREKIKNLLITLLPDVEDIIFTELDKNNLKPGLKFKTPYGNVSLKELSLGYRTLLAWMVDLASKLFDRYPASLVKKLMNQVEMRFA